MKRFAVLLFLGLMLCALPAFSQKITDNFYVTVAAGVVLSGGGTGFDGGHWYAYPSMWINEWFYDHPFDPTRGKIIHLEFDWIAYDPGCDTDINVAINWSTPEWSALGYGETQPPLPGVDEELYIVRETVLDVCGRYATTQHFETDYIVYDYNPEWVSVDVMGCNFIITNGVLIHECAVGAENTSWGELKANIE